MLESGENYLETILLLEKKNGFVRSVDIANALEYTKPSISRAMAILKKNEFIAMIKRGEIILTKKGREKAEEIYERHRAITEFMVMTLGISRDLADKDACRIEHVISKESFQKLKEYVNQK